MTALTAPDVDDVLIIVEGTWRPLEPAQSQAWRSGLLGMEHDHVMAAVRDIAALGSDHPPSWAAFRANYIRAKNHAHEIAETEARIDAPPPVDMMADRRYQSTYIRLCQAYCRQALKPEPERRKYLNILFGEWPDEFGFEPVMRGVARAIDELDPAIPFAQRVEIAIGAHDPATFEPMPMAPRPHRTGKHFEDEWQAGKTVDGDRFHLTCQFLHKPAEPCPGTITARYDRVEPVASIEGRA